jgi:hypothetical protein
VRSKVSARAGPLCTLHPTDVYDLAGAMLALRLNKTTLRREIREKRLRCACRAGRRYILGAWLLAWLESAPPPRPAGVNGQAAAQ